MGLCHDPGAMQTLFAKKRIDGYSQISYFLKQPLDYEAILPKPLPSKHTSAIVAH